MTERLEEIKEEYRDAIRVIGIARKDIDYLIQQAETAKELKKENMRYKQALERILVFYPGVPNADFIPVEMLFEIKGIAYRALEREG